MGVSLPQAATVGELEALLGGHADSAIRGLRVTGLSTPAQARSASELVVLTSARHLPDARRAPGPTLCTELLADRVPEGRRWVHAHVMWAVTRLLGGPAAYPPSAPAAATQVAPGAEVSPSARIAAGAVILDGARIGPQCIICENCVIYGGVKLGARVVVGPLSVLGRPGFGWTPDPDGTLIRVAHVGGVVIEDDVEIGPLCTVDAGTLEPTRIETGAKLDAHVHVGHNVRIGTGSMVAGQAGFAGSVEIGEGVLVGGQAGVADHVRIGAGARIAAHSGVIGDVPAGAVVAGFPAVKRMRWLRAWARLLELAGSRRS